MAGTFELFHLSLLEQAQTDMFAGQTDPSGLIRTWEPEVPNRERWLRICFEKPFSFNHRTNIVHWVPAEAESKLIAGNLVRSHPRRHHAPPEEGAMEVLSEEWQGSMVVIDPTHHDDGQKLSFERDETLGRPRSVLQSLAAHLNAIPGAPYVIEPKPIFNEDSFWNWAAGHEYKLHSITFEFIVPNMWGSKSALDEDLRQLGEIGVSRAKVTLDEGSKKTGVDARGQQVRDGVDYAAQGGGSITAKAKNGDRFSSTDNTSTAKLPAQGADRTGGIKGLVKWFPKLLGREQDDSLDDTAGPDDGPSDS